MHCPGKAAQMSLRLWYVQYYLILSKIVLICFAEQKKREGGVFVLHVATSDTNKILISINFDGDLRCQRHFL